MSVKTDSEYLTARQVCERYGTSRMWIFRRLKFGGFPAPIVFGGRYRHFKLSELEAWERA